MLGLWAQGTATGVKPVLGTAIDSPKWEEGPGGPRIEVYDNRVLNDIPLRASAVAADASLLNRSANEQHAERWVVNASTSFVSLGTGTVWIVGPAVGWNPSPSRTGEREKAVSEKLRGDSLRAEFDCDGTAPVLSVDYGRSALLITQPPEAGPLFARAHSGDTNWAYVGVDNSVRWTSGGDVSFFGHIGGDPAKVFVVQLDHPNGTTRWQGLPTTYQMGIGDVFLSLHGPAGDYRLSTTGAGSWLFSFRAVVVLH